MRIPATEKYKGLLRQLNTKGSWTIHHCGIGRQQRSRLRRSDLRATEGYRQPLSFRPLIAVYLTRTIRRSPYSPLSASGRKASLYITYHHHVRVCAINRVVLVSLDTPSERHASVASYLSKHLVCPPPLVIYSLDFTSNIKGPRGVPS